ncbi:DUF4440 domain-containing protein [Rahnella sp. RcJ3]|uniref:nuclear transport factor 2 family protein n=1 Tax=Rahnella sp. RcJ3 TaxID=2292446 RepID=UPI00351A201B
MLLEKLKALECSLHGARRNDRKWLEQILHPEFREITRSGVIVDRAETIASLAVELSPTIILSSDFRLLSIGEYCAILHYKTFNSDGSRASLRSSCWWVYSDRGNGSWLSIREHQKWVQYKFGNDTLKKTTSPVGISYRHGKPMSAFRS